MALFAIGAAVAGGIASAISNANQSSQIQEAIKRARALAAQGLISQDELSDRLNSIDRQFNQRLTSVLNTTAIRSRGLVNRGVVGAAAAGQVEGARLSAKDNAVAQAQTINANVQNQLAQIELSGAGAGSDPIGSFVEGAVGGFTAGLEGERRFDRDSIPELPVGGAESAIGTGTSGPTSSSPFNPFQQNKQTLGGPQDLGKLNPFGGRVNLDFLENVRF